MTAPTQWHHPLDYDCILCYAEEKEIICHSQSKPSMFDSEENHNIFKFLKPD